MSSKLEISLVGLITSPIPFTIQSVADGIANGTRPLVKDEVVEQLNAAAETVRLLNETLMEAVKQIP